MESGNTNTFTETLSKKYSLNPDNYTNISVKTLNFSLRIISINLDFITHILSIEKGI